MPGAIKVWSKFSATNSTGTVVKLRIVDMPIHCYVDVVDLFVKYFATEESTFRAAGVPNSPEALAEYRQFMLQLSNDDNFHIVICCLDSDDDEINSVIAASAMTLTTAQELLQEKTQGQAETAETMIKLSELYNEMVAMYDETKFNLDRFFIDRGIVVHPDYRGLGIAQEFFKVRRLICKSYGVSINGAWMTSYGSQIAAERDGWETVYEIDYDELGKRYGVTFENGPRLCKYMIARI